MVPEATDRRADPEREGPTDDRRALPRREPLDELVAHLSADPVHDLLRQRRGHHLAPERGADLPAGDLAGELIDELGARRAEDHRHHEHPCALGVVECDAVHLGHGLREQRRGLEEPDGLGTAQPEGRRHAHARDHRTRTDRRTTRGHRREVLPFEDLDDLGRGRIGVSTAESPHVGDDRRALDTEHTVEHLHPACWRGLLGGARVRVAGDGSHRRCRQGHDRLVLLLSGHGHDGTPDAWEARWVNS
ncbi:MAG: hypothetical protein ACTHMH_12770, partial [Curtobacterium sp.]